MENGAYYYYYYVSCKLAEITWVASKFVYISVVLLGASVVIKNLFVDLRQHF